LRELGGFDESYSVAEDMKIIAEIAFRYPVFVADACNTEYGRTRESLWSRSAREGRDAECRRRFRKWMKALIEREAADDPELLTQFMASLISIAPLIGGRILGRPSSSAPPGGADDALDIVVGPSPASWTTSMRLEAGQYILKVLGERDKGPLAVEVAIGGGGHDVGVS
jgi:hypothetical protein